MLRLMLTGVGLGVITGSALKVEGGEIEFKRRRRPSS